LPGFAVVEGLGPEPVSERFRHPGAVAAILASAADVVLPPAAASDPGLPGLAVGKGPGPEPVSECFRYPGAVVACVYCPERSAGVELNAGCPAAALDFSSEALPAFPAGQAQVIFVL